MPVTREKRKGGRSRFVNDRDDDHEDEGGDEGESIKVSIDEFMDWAQKAVSKGDTSGIARLRADLIEARRKKNFWKQKYFELNEEAPEGSVVLIDDEAAAITKLRENKVDLKKLPDLISTFENDKATLTAENLKFKNRELYGEFEKTSGYNKAAIEGAVTNEHLHAEMGDVKVEKTDQQGKKTTETKKTLMVRKAADPKAPLVPFDEYIEKNANWMWPALKTKDATASSTSSQSANFSEQTSTSDGSKGGALSRFMQRANEQAAGPQRQSPLNLGAQQTTPPQQRPGTQRG